MALFNKWTLINLAPLVLMILFPVVDSLTGYGINNIEARAQDFLPFGIIATLATVVSFFKTKGKARIGAVLGFLTGIVFLLWMHFILTFNFAF